MPHKISKHIPNISKCFLQLHHNGTCSHKYVQPWHVSHVSQHVTTSGAGVWDPDKFNENNRTQLPLSDWTEWFQHHHITGLCHAQISFKFIIGSRFNDMTYMSFSPSQHVYFHVLQERHISPTVGSMWVNVFRVQPWECCGNRYPAPCLEPRHVTCWRVACPRAHLGDGWWWVNEQIETVNTRHFRQRNRKIRKVSLE